MKQTGILNLINDRVSKERNYARLANKQILKRVSDQDRPCCHTFRYIKSLCWEVMPDLMSEAKTYVRYANEKLNSLLVTIDISDARY
jgi:hypothetical protein